MRKGVSDAYNDGAGGRRIFMLSIVFSDGFAALRGAGTRLKLPFIKYLRAQQSLEPGLHAC